MVNPALGTQYPQGSGLAMVLENGDRLMVIIHITNDSTFAGGFGKVDGEGFVGPFANENIARFWACDNITEGAEYRIVSLTDICEATLSN